MASIANLGGIRLAGNVVWCNKPRKVVTRERTGKGFPRPTVATTTYYSDLMIMFGQGPLSLLKLEANSDVLLDFTGTGPTGIYDSAATTPMARYDKAPTPDANGVIAGTMQGGGNASFVIYPGNYDQLPDPDYQADVGVANAPAFRGRFCIKIKNFNLSKYNGVPAFYATVAHQEINSTAKLAYHFARRVGIEMGDIDLSPIEGDSEAYLRGLAELNRYSPRDALEKASLPHALEFYENADGKLTARYHGTPTAFAIDPNHLGAVEGLNLFTDNQVPSLIDFHLVDGAQVHREITVNAFDPDQAHESSAQTAYLSGGDSEGGLGVNLPMTLTADETRRTAERLLYQEQVGRETAKFTLPPLYSWHDPTDIAEVQDDTMTHRLRIQKISNVLPGVMEVEAVRDDAEVYLQTISGQASAGYPSSAQVVQVPQATTLLLLDTVTLRDSDDSPLVYVAACPSATDGTWAGCTVMRDKGSGYEAMDALTLPAIIGTAVNALSTVSDPNLWDETNTVDIDLLTNDTLSSATEEAVLNGANAALLGSAANGWELIQFRSATQPDATNHPKRWRLSGLLRGRRGSDFATSTHAINDYFVILDSAILPLELDLTERGIARNWKGVTRGQLEANATAQSFTWAANNLKPLSVVNVDGTRDGANNLTIAWIRRTRIGGSWMDLIDASLSEATEAYEVEVIVSSSVVRTISVTSPTASYSAANQTADGITPGNPVTFRVYQLSARVGRGFVRQATL